MRDPAKLTLYIGLILLVLSAVPYLLLGQFFWLGGFVGLFLVCVGAWATAWDRVPIQSR